MNESDMKTTLGNLSGFVENPNITQPVKPGNYDDWQFFYSQARAEGLGEFQAAEMAYKNCEAEK